MSIFTPIAAILFACLIPGVAVADEADFLTSLHGNWAGEGMVTIRIGFKPIGVSCAFSSTGNGNSFSMNGNCRGLLIINRAISAKLQANGTRYSGVYIGPSGGRSLLSGTRSGDTINLTVRWAKEVNGDFAANMLIRKTGENSLSLLTNDRDPKTGRNVMTSDIVLQRRL
jgi:hypothetical protein